MVRFAAAAAGLVALFAAASAQAACAPARERVLGRTVHQKCDRPSACRLSMPLTTLQQYLTRNNECIAARQTVRDECYGGASDQGHTTQITNKQNAARNCQTQIARKAQPQRAPRQQQAPRQVAPRN